MEDKILSKKRRIHVTNACQNCKKRHMSCDFARPCRRCAYYGVECVEGESKKRGRKKKCGGLSHYHIKEEKKTDIFEDYGIDMIEKTLNNAESNKMDGLIPYFIPKSSYQQTPTFQQILLEDFFSGNIGDEVSLSTPSDLPEKNETPSTFCRTDAMAKIREFISSKVPDRAYVLELIKDTRDQLIKLREGLTADAVATIWSQFSDYLAEYGTAFDSLGIPTLIWERSGRIHYVNQAYVDITGFNESLPTDLNNLSFYKQISTDGLRQVLDRMVELYSKDLKAKRDSWMFPAGIKGLSGEYIQGVMCLTVKRDFLGLPLLFVGNFMPTNLNSFECFPLDFLMNKL